MSKQNDMIDTKTENGQKRFRSRESDGLSQDETKVKTQAQAKDLVEAKDLAQERTSDQAQISSDKKALTREARRSLQEEEKGKGKKRREKKGRLRIFPVWLKIILSLILFAAAFGGGLMFGYGIVGDGERPGEALEKETWYSIYDFIFQDTEHQRE